MRPDLISVLRILGIAGVAFLFLPVAAVLLMSFSNQATLSFPGSEWSIRWYRHLFNDPAWRQPLHTSLRVAAMVATASTILGGLGAYGMRGLRGRWEGAAVLAFLLPLLIPPVALAVGFVLVFARADLVDTQTGLVIAHTLLALPFGFLLTAAALARTDPRLETAALSLGAPRWYAFVRVVFPQIWTGLAAGWVLGFLVSFDEPVLALFLASNRTRTLPRQLFDGVRYDLDPTGSAVAGLLILVTLLLGAYVAFQGKFARAGRLPTRE